LGVVGHRDPESERNIEVFRGRTDLRTREIPDDGFALDGSRSTRVQSYPFANERVCSAG